MTERLSLSFDDARLLADLRKYGVLWQAAVVDMVGVDRLQFARRRQDRAGRTARETMMEYKRARKVNS